MVKYSKGSTIAKVTPWKAIPLFDDEDADRLLSKLPRRHHHLAADHDGFPEASAQPRTTTRRRPSNVVAFPHIPTKRIRQRVFQQLAKVTETNRLVASTLIAPSVVVIFHLLHQLRSNKNTPPATAVRQSLLDSIGKELKRRQHEGMDNEDQATVVLEQCPLVKLAWEELNVVEARERAVGGLLDWSVWLQLLARIARSMCLVVEQKQHPLLEYATQEVPHLNQSELRTVCDSLQLNTSSQKAKNKHDKTSLLSPLVVQKWIRDHVEEQQPERIFAVLLSLLSFNNDDGEKEDRKDCSSLAASAYQHSCLPTAQLELTEDGTIAVTALYDIQDDEDVCISWIRENNNHTVEERDAALQIKMGHSCTCLRCRYEMTDDSCSIALDSSPFSNDINDATRLARYYMATGDLTRAKDLYKLALKQLQQCSNTALRTSRAADLAAVDLYHVLGAIELTNKKFLSAQRIWKQAADNYPGTNHPGIEVQLEKMKPYNYFKRARPSLKGDLEAKSVIGLESLVPGAFIARVIDDSTCQQVIDWAEKQGEWTQQRHYAVPTYDVPVHNVPELLHWFQHDLMTRVMQPLLARQFGTKKGCFYVHDAFVVRYTGSSSSNHLPIHTDESTHSFVLALNDDFEGGGTYFYERDKVVRPPKGCTLSFAGGEIFHGGERVTSGVRYILAVFLYHDEDSNTESIQSNGGEKHLKREVAPTGTISTVFRESKQQKTEAFSFGFVL